ncbi:MAG TPA: hypothetical protein VFW30_01575 [Bryocella sp.]|nr:hypothetical protein [Bryocella sp.]
MPLAQEFVFGPRYMRLPEGYFVLVRKGNEVGAFRLQHVSQKQDGTGTSMYESFILEKERPRNISLTNQKSGVIEIKQVRGIHPFTWQPGNNEIHVGAWKFGCLTPSLVNMSSHFSESDDGFEFAPTAAQTPTDIKPFDQNLRWVHFDNESRVTIPITAVAK